MGEEGGVGGGEGLETVLRAVDLQASNSNVLNYVAVLKSAAVCCFPPAARLPLPRVFSALPFPAFVG